MRRLVPFVLVTILTCVVAGCGTSGRDLRAPEEGAVSPTRSTSTTSASGAAASAARSLSLKSREFPSGGVIPDTFLCNGPSPQMQWSGVPSGTSELALAAVEPDADRYVHWLVTGITPADGSTQQGQAPPEATVLTNSAGVASWSGPCPAPGTTPGTTPKTINFILLALPQATAVPAGTPPAVALEELQTAAQGRIAILNATY